MWIILIVLIVIAIALFFVWYIRSQKLYNPIMETDFYALRIKGIDGEILSFDQFRGKKVLVVNVASECGFTDQYASLQNLYELYQDQLVILGVPSNQFLGQEPWNEADIKQFCQKNYGVSFPLAEKVNVFGADQHPVYQWLTRKDLNWVKNSRVTRNFQKYLVDESWHLLAHFSPNTIPFDKRITQYLV